MQRVAYEHEGLEVAEWLNTLGVTACVLKYRVPAPSQTGAIDAQRAMGLIRSRATEWKIDADALGIMGFSAGGEIGALLLTHHDGRLYPEVDAADKISCRPDFAALIYTGGVLQRDGSVKEPIAGRIKAGLPPVFMAHAFDDSSRESLALAMAFKRAGVPTELHLYREGGHGFGARNTGIPTGTWKDRFADWMRDLGHLDSAPLRDLAKRTAAALASRQAPPSFTSTLPTGSLVDAYAAQKRLVRSLAVTDPVAGYKASAASASAQKDLGIDGPLAGVVFKSGRLDGREVQVIQRAEGEQVTIEPALGYIVSVDISYEVLNDEQARGAVESVMPVVELPKRWAVSGSSKAKDLVAANLGSGRYLVGTPVKADGFKADAVAISLRRDGKEVGQGSGADVAGGQWRNLRLLLNSITRSGYTIPAGSLILSGAVVPAQSGENGRYEAAFGDLGTITFELK